MQLTTEQQQALATLVEFANGSWRHDAWAMTLGGYAGTGKTTVISQLQAKIPFKRVAYTAPTHKAVHVMSGIARHSEEDYRTIHSLLGLRPSQSHGKTTLKKVAGTSLGKYDLVVVDECSMVGADLFGYIQKASEEFRVKFLFMGDPAQLPPVGESLSPTFHLDGVILSTVMRQRGEHPVLAFCTDIRQAWVEGRMVMPSPVADFCKTSRVGLHIMQGELFSELMPRAFVESDFDMNPDRFKVIAWRNSQVDAYNTYIQHLRYPDIGDKPFANGEHVIFSEPVMPRAIVNHERNPDAEPVINNETASRVIGHPIKAIHPIYPDIPAWKVATTEDDAVWVLGQDGKGLHRIALKILERQIKAPDPNQPKKDWRDFYALKEAFATVRPAYAMTAHKSQGSTFENVFVDAADIMSNQNKREAMQCLYVACSRTTHNLIVNAA